MATELPVFGNDLKQLFLDKLAEYGNITLACSECRISVSTAQRHREADPLFGEAWKEAAAIGLQALEDEAKRRAFKGWDEKTERTKKISVAGVTGAEERTITTVNKYSDSLLMFLLKGLKAEYKDKPIVVTGPGGGPVRHTLEMSKSELMEIAAQGVSSEGKPIGSGAGNPS